MNKQKFFINQLVHNVMQHVNRMAVEGTPEQREMLTVALTYTQMLETQLQLVKPSMVTAARISTLSKLAPVLKISQPVIDGEDSYVEVTFPEEDTKEPVNNQEAEAQDGADTGKQS